MALDLATLAQSVSKHVSTCTSARFLCTTQASFESWFRVELVPILMEMGVEYDTISPDYTYPSSNHKADLVCSTEGGQIIMELKSFASKQDRNKRNQYPEQIKRLYSLINQNASIAQVITFTTFQGYSPRQLSALIEGLFNPLQWSMVGPAPVVKAYPSLQFLIAGIIRTIPYQADVN